MTLKTYSPSKLKTLSQCGHHYHLKYEKGLKVEASSMAMWMGNVVETAIEYTLKDPERRVNLQYCQAVADNLRKFKANFTEEFMGALEGSLLQMTAPITEKVELKHYRDLNREAFEIAKQSKQLFPYKTRCKTPDGYNVAKKQMMAGKDLFHNILIKGYEDVSRLFNNRVFLTFLEDVVDIDYQTELRETFSLDGIPFQLQGYSDFIFKMNDGRLVLLDCKYSGQNNQEDVNIDHCVQLYSYVRCLKKMYPEALEINAGLLAPAIEDDPFLMADHEKLMSPETLNILKQAIRLERANIRPVRCHGEIGDLQMRCYFKEVCSYASCVKGGTDEPADDA